MCGYSELVVAVVGGVLVYVLGDIINSLYIGPIKKYNDLRSEICFCLIEYANMYNNPCHSNEQYQELDGYKKAHEELRKLGSKLLSFAQERKFIASVFIPKKTILDKAASYLIFLSNNLVRSEYDNYLINKKYASAARLYLNLDFEYCGELGDLVKEKKYIKILKKNKCDIEK